MTFDYDFQLTFNNFYHFVLILLIFTKCTKFTVENFVNLLIFTNFTKFTVIKSGLYGFTDIKTTKIPTFTAVNSSF